jgi:hypothetical protein
MVIGNPSVFAIESEIAQAYQRLSQRALGFFVVHVGGRRFGICESHATMLGCSFDAVQRRIARRGTHTAAFATEPDAGKIADAFRNAVYAEDRDEDYFGIPRAEFRKLFNQGSSDLMWAPDGDEAFDDGSYVLQFDVEDRVRLIAFKSCDGYIHDPVALSDVWLPADDFYRVLQRWQEAFDSEWAVMPKT